MKTEHQIPWWKFWHKEPPVDSHAGDTVDTYQDIISLDGHTANGLFFALSMNYGVASLSWNAEDDVWELDIAGQTFAGKTQMEALLKAREAL